MMLIISMILMLIIWGAFQYNLFSDLTVCILICLFISSIGLSIIECVNVQDERLKEYYKDGPIFQKEIKIGNKNCEEYQYYDKTIFKCDDRVFNIVENDE